MPSCPFQVSANKHSLTESHECEYHMCVFTHVLTNQSKVFFLRLKKKDKESTVLTWRHICNCRRFPRYKYRCSRSRHPRTLQECTLRFCTHRMLKDTRDFYLKNRSDTKFIQISQSKKNSQKTSFHHFP